MSLNDRDAHDGTNSSNIARFAKGRKHTRVDWPMHILSFLSTLKRFGNKGVVLLRGKELQSCLDVYGIIVHLYIYVC